MTTTAAEPVAAAAVPDTSAAAASTQTSKRIAFHELRVKIAPEEEKEEENAGVGLSKATLAGLRKAGYTHMTDIQREVLPHALAGRDVLAAARTGSGKTLAFLVPVLETLHRNKWHPEHDGLGALVLSPTRELALQIFQVLRNIGAKHDFSAGLLVGGTDARSVAEEQVLVGRMNILVATPGRLLQHMNSTEGFDCTGLKILVLDEADRILDLGFAEALDAILENLPKHRQTLLYSATQTRRVKDLARLSLTTPVYVNTSLDETTPAKLVQSYQVCELPEKLQVVWDFIKTHKTSKVICFFSTCKQVRFVYEAFCKLSPGTRLLHLHGKQGQRARMDVVQQFTEAKAAVLFATDVASRGLDFPNVQWVLQADAPEDTDAYIHRVGRTARYFTGGSSLLLLLPSERAGMLELLAKRKINITQRAKGNRPEAVVLLKPKLAALCSERAELRYLAEKALVTYIRSMHRNMNKKVFCDIKQLPVQEFAEAIGLAVVPSIKLLKQSTVAACGTRTVFEDQEEEVKEESGAERADVKEMNSREGRLKQRKTAAGLGKRSKPDDNDNNEEEENSENDFGLGPIANKKRKENVTKLDRLLSRKNPILERQTQQLQEEDDACEDDLFTVVAEDSNEERNKEEYDRLVMRNAKLMSSHRRLLREREKVRKNMPAPKHLVFEALEDKEDEVIVEKVVAPVRDASELTGLEGQAKEYLDTVRTEMSQRDKQDKEAQRQRLRERRIRRRNKQKENASALPQ